MYKLDLEKAEEPEIKLPTSYEKQENFRKTSTSAALTSLKPLTTWIATNCGKFLKRWEYQTTLPASCETCMQVKEQQLEPDMEQRTSSKWEKEYVKAVYCHPAYLTYIQGCFCCFWVTQLCLTLCNPMDCSMLGLPAKLLLLLSRFSHVQLCETP